jgi:hypothetical protein
MLEWRERENDLEDQIAANDPNTLLALYRCGLEIFFQVHGMKTKFNY